MRKTIINRRAFLVGATSWTVTVTVSGCGAFKKAVNDRIDPIANPGNLEGVQFPVPVSSGTTRVPADGAGSYTGQFPDIAPVSQQNRLTFTELSQNLRGEITYVPGGGTAFPTRILLNSVSLAIRLGDGSGVVPGPTREVIIPPLRPAQGTLTFDRVGESDRYRWNQSGEIRLGSVRVSGDDARRLFALLTETDNQNQPTNTVAAMLSFASNLEGIESALGAILFTFGTGQARVGI